MRIAPCIGVLLSATVLGGCAHLGHQGDDESILGDKTYEPAQLFRDFKTVATQLTVDEQASKDDPYGDAPAKKYLNQGITLSNMACQTWLSALGKNDRDTQYGKNLLNIAGSLILGLAGVNGASSSSLAKGALGLTAANAAVDAYRADILQGVISDIEPKIREGRTLSAAKARGDEGPRTYFLVKEYLVEYHATCSSNEIKRLLSTSLKEVKYSFDQATLTDAVTTATAAKDNADLFQAIFGQRGSFDDPTLVEIYGLLTGQAEVAETIAPVSPLASMAKTEYDKAANKSAIQLKLANLATSKDLPTKLKALIKERAAKQVAETKLKQELIQQGQATPNDIDSAVKLDTFIRQQTLDRPTKQLIEQYREAQRLQPAAPARRLFPSITPMR